MDISSIGHFRNYLRVATLSSEVFLHQAEVDVEGIIYTGVIGLQDCMIL